MKASLVITAVSALMLGAACTREAVVIVENASNSPEMVLRHTVPVGRATSLFIQDTLSVSGDLSFTVEASQPVFLFLQDVQKPKNSTVFPVRRGETYHLAYDGAAFSFIGTGQDVQRLYNAIPRYSHPQLEARAYARDSDPVRVQTRLDSVRAAQMAPFDSLRAAGGIPADLYELIAADRECNFKSVMAEVGVLQHADAAYREFWDSSFKNFNPDSDRLLSAFSYFDMMGEYAVGKLMEREEEIMPQAEAGQVNTLMVNECKKVLTGKRLESIYAALWLQAAFQKRYEKELIPLYEEFKQTYPHSPYLAAMKGYYDEIVAFHAPKELSEDFHFLEDTESLLTLDALLSRFAGRKLYVDVWATWCGPCKEEFAHEEALHELLEEKGFEMLYLSVDQDKDDAKWRQMVGYYKLRGHHVRAGEALQQDLVKAYGAGGSMAIPWNLIVDPAGRIVQLHAPRPSESEALSAALDSVQ